MRLLFSLIGFILLASQGAGSSEISEHLQLINEFRIQSGLTPLLLLPELSRIAQQHSDNLAKKDSLSHTDPVTGADLTDRISISDIYAETASENAGIGDSHERVFSKFKNSPKHRRNLSDPKTTHVGIGISHRDNLVFIVQNFIRKIDVIDPASLIESFFRYLNIRREENGYPPLSLNDQLTRRACLHVRYMVEEDRLFFPQWQDMKSYKIYCLTTPDPLSAIQEIDIWKPGLQQVGICFEIAKTGEHPMGIYWGAILLK